MRVRVDVDLCQGHGRCYATAPDVFAPDDLGNGREVGDGTVPTGMESQAKLATANCPERAIVLEENT
jgi:ferredoxin